MRHFIINISNLDNGKTLGVSGDECISYADVRLGGEGMTILVQVSGGCIARIEPPLLISKNWDSNCPIRTTADHVPGIAFRTGRKWCMDQTVMQQFL